MATNPASSSALFRVTRPGLQRLSGSGSRAFLAIGMLLLACGFARWGRAAEGPDEFYVQIYGLIQEADRLKDQGQAAAAVAKYREADTSLRQLQKANPTWNEKVVQYRLRYLAGKIAALEPPADKPAPAVTAPPPPAQGFSVELDGQIRASRQLIQQLEADKQLLEARLKEALSAQPAAADPRELAKAETRVADLQKENELLKVSLEQEQSKMARLVDPAVVEDARRQLTEANQQLLQQSEMLTTLKQERQLLQRRVQTLSEKGEALRTLTTENQALKQEIATLQPKAEAAAQLELVQQSLNLAQANLDQERQRTEKLVTDKTQLETRLKEILAIQNLSKDVAQPLALNQPVDEARLALAQDLEALQVRLREMKAALESEQEQRGKLAIEKSGLAARLGDAAKEVETQRATAEAAQRSAESLQKELDLTQRELTQERLRSEGLRADRATLEEQNRTTQAKQQDEATERIRTLEKDLAAARAEVADGKRAIASLQSTLSGLEAEKRTWDKARADLEARLATNATQPQAPGAVDIAHLQELEKERDDLRSRYVVLVHDFDRLKAQAEAAPSAPLRRELDALQARIATYEAQKVPYTPEELALFRRPAPSAATLSQGAENPLPASAVSLLNEAEQAFADGRYADAEQRYRDLLKPPGEVTNRLVLLNLAVTLTERDRYGEAEVCLRTALAQAPDDPRGLGRYGYLRFRQGKTDEAIEVLTQVAQREPLDAEVHHYLGLALSQKGMRLPAETALRKAVQLRPGYPSAHQNLAVVYATQHPPFMALARWHYQKALAAGQPANPELGRLIESGIRTSLSQ